MTPRQIRNWMLQHPKPASLRLVMPDGSVDDVEVRGSFVKLADTIAAKGPELLEARGLAPKRELLRAIKLSEPETTRSDAATVPEEIRADPTALMLTHLANLVHRAYEHSTEIAFGKLIELVERMDARSDAIEQRLERTEAMYRRTLQAQLDDAWERAEAVAEEAAAKIEEAGGDPSQQLMQAFMQGAAQGGVKPARPNGKGKPSA